MTVGVVVKVLSKHYLILSHLVRDGDGEFVVNAINGYGNINSAVNYLDLAIYCAERDLNKLIHSEAYITHPSLHATERLEVG